MKFSTFKNAALVAAVMIFVFGVTGCDEPKTAASFKVITKPANAKIFVNGRFVAKSPCVVTVRDRGAADHWERHLIEAQLAGYEMQNYEISYRTGAAWVEDVVVLELTKSPNFKPWKNGEEIAIGNKKKNEYVGKSPWDVKTEPDPVTDEIDELEASRRKRQKYTGQAPWKRGNSYEQELTAAEKTLNKTKIAKLNHERNFQCELRLVRVTDGKVIAQHSAIASYKNGAKLVKILIGRLLKHMPEEDIPVAAVSLCNRRRTEIGLKLSEAVTEAVKTELEKSQVFDTVSMLNLRSLVSSELMLENGSLLTGQHYRTKLDGAKYIVVGGVAFERNPDTISENQEIYGSVRKKTKRKN